MSERGDLPEVVFQGFQFVGAGLRVAFAVVDAGEAFTAWADLSADGVVFDLHASDSDSIGSTGRPGVDGLVRRHAAAELARARAAAVVAEFDRREWARSRWR